MVPKTLHHPWIRRKPDGYHQQYLVHCAKSFCKVRLNLLLSIFNFDLVDLAHRHLEHEPTVRNGFSCRDLFPKDPDPSLEEDSGFQSHPLNRNVGICFVRTYLDSWGYVSRKRNWSRFGHWGFTIYPLVIGMKWNCLLVEIPEICTKKPGLDVFDVTGGLDDQTKNRCLSVIPIYITSSDNCQVGLEISWYKVS